MTAFDYEDIKDLSPTKYGEVSKESLWKNLEYFLKAVVPEAEKYGIKLAMHPDDPQVDSIRGISRIMTTADAFRTNGCNLSESHITELQCARVIFR